MSLFWGLLWNIKWDVKESWNFSIGYQSVLKFAWEYSVGYVGGKWKFQYNWCNCFKVCCGVQS